MISLFSQSFFPCYLTTLSVSGLYSIGDRLINEYGTVGGMRIGRGNWSTWRKPAPVILSTTNQTWADLESELGHSFGSYNPSASYRGNNGEMHQLGFKTMLVFRCLQALQEGPLQSYQILSKWCAMVCKCIKNKHIHTFLIDIRYYIVQSKVTVSKDIFIIIYNT
jgi:hypothetical protein